MRAYEKISNSQQALDRAEFEAKRLLGEEIKCPCCDKIYNAVYKRTLSPAMCKALIMLKNRNYLSAVNTGDFAKLKHWGLIDRIDGKYEITMKGLGFIAGQARVPEYVILQNNRLIEKSDELVSIYDVFERE